MATSTAPTAGTILQGLGSNLASDAAGGLAGLLNGFFVAIQKNPAPANVVAQGALLMAAAPLSLPNLEAEAITQFGAAGQALVALIPTNITV
jgi:hypothetical protein